MSVLATLPQPVLLIAALLAGGLVGGLHFAGLERASADHLAGRMGPALGLHLLRWGVTIAVLVGLARLGALPLLLGALGLLGARAVVMRRMRDDGRARNEGRTP